MISNPPFSGRGVIDLGAETGADTVVSVAALDARLQAMDDQLKESGNAGASKKRGRLLLNTAEVLLDLDRGAQAWDRAHEAFRISFEIGDRELAVAACELMFHADQADSLAALGQGVWLAVTYPVDPTLSVRMLRHIIDETPDQADGAAVAAAAAAYIVELRARGKEHNDLSMETLEMLGTVARAHGEVHDQAQFDAWMTKLELNDPQKFLVRLRNVVDVLVQDQWWFDRDRLRAQLPVN
jgi:hypothetical protein